MFLTRSEKIFGALNWVLLAIIGLVCAFPIYYILAVSLTSNAAYNQDGFQVIPSALSLDSYHQILRHSVIPRAYLNTIIIVASGTLLSLVLTALTAYPLANRRLPGRRVFLGCVVFTIVFSGGLIPLFILVRSLGIMNTYWAVILPYAIWSWNVLILKAFFESVPEELVDAARVDGANEFVILRRIVLPISKPALATIGLFYAVGLWNDFFTPYMFLTDQRLQPLAVVLRAILRDLMGGAGTSAVDVQRMAPNDGIRMAAVFLSMVPILLVYPLLQRYFTKGILLGSIKG